MTRLRQLAAVLLCTALLLALPATCLHVFSMRSASLSGGCGSLDHQSAPMDGMPSRTSGSSPALPHPPQACCTAHAQPPALLSSLPHLPDLQGNRLPILAWLPAMTPSTTTGATVSPRPPPLRSLTPLRI